MQAVAGGWLARCGAARDECGARVGPSITAVLVEKQTMHMHKPVPDVILNPPVAGSCVRSIGQTSACACALNLFYDYEE